jgi:hypothetical protein
MPAATARNNSSEYGSNARGAVGGIRRCRRGSCRCFARRDRARQGRRCATRRRETETRERGLVEAVLAAEQFVDAFEKFTGLRALDHAVIVGARQRQDLFDAKRAERLGPGVCESGRIGDGARRDDRALARGQPRDRRHGADAAGVGQAKRGAGQIVGPELVVAGLRYQRFVRGSELGEIERVRPFDDRDDQKPRAVLALRVDGDTEVDSAGDARRRAVVAAKARHDGGKFARRAR